MANIGQSMVTQKHHSTLTSSKMAQYGAPKQAYNNADRSIDHTQKIANKSMLSKIKAKIHAWTSDTESENRSLYMEEPIRKSSYVHIHADRMHFSITRAHGGYIVQYETHKPYNDSSEHATHIIPEDADLEESIARIVSHQLLIK